MSFTNLINGGKQIKAGSVDASRLDLASITSLSNLSTVGTIGSGSWQGSAVAVGYGGTGASNASGARANLGLAIGTDVQAYSSTLDSVAGGTYQGASSIVTVGTITSGAWHGSRIDASYLPSLDAMTVAAADLSLNSHKIVNLADPTSAQDAATKSYVDLLKAGMQMKAAARVRSTSNVNLSSPGASIDGVTLANGDRALCNNQTDAKQNGVYVFNGASSAMTRAADWDTPNVAEGDYLFIVEGSAPGIGFILTTPSPVVGTSNLVFVEFTRLNQVSVGNGLSKSGNTINLQLDGATLSKSASGVKVADGGIGNSQLASAAVATSNIQDAAVTAAKLASGVAGNGLSGGAGSALAVKPFYQSFSGDGSSTAFTLSGSVLSNVSVFLEGQRLNNADVTVSGTSLTIAGAPDAGAHIEVVGIAA